MCVGVALSAVNFLKILFIDQESVFIAATVCLAMVFIVIFAKVIGGIVPLLAEKAGVDPALMANPVIASSTDMISVLVYFLMAKLILGL